MQKVSFEEIIQRLEKIDLPDIDMVIGITSGGVIPASLIAQKLGCKLNFLHLNYRDKKNNPCHSEPLLLSAFHPPAGVHSVLLVDDVSISGKTMETAKGIFKNYDVKTLVFKGKADYVLLPEVEGCVDWPWNELNKKERILK